MGDFEEWFGSGGINGWFSEGDLRTNRMGIALSLPFIPAMLGISESLDCTATRTPDNLCEFVERHQQLFEGRSEFRLLTPNALPDGALGLQDPADFAEHLLQTLWLVPPGQSLESSS
jgi:hypothetical protein